MNLVKELPIEEDNLWEQYSVNRDINIRNQIVEKYSYLVKIIALKIRGIYQQFGDVEDVVNEGIIALIDIIDKYDLSKNVKFETYATFRIKGAIIDYVRKQDWTPRKVKNDTKIINEAEKELGLRLGRTPTDNEIADFLRIDIKEYNQIVRNNLSSNIISFEELVSEVSFKEKEVSNGYEQPEEAYETKELSRALRDSINQLNDKEKLVISLYYKEDIKLKDIANILDISNSRASQIHSAALEKLQKSIKTYIDDKK